MTRTCVSQALLTLSLALTLGWSSPASAQDAARPADAPQLTKGELRHQGRKRTFYYHGKVNKRSARTKPVLFVLHGGGGTPARAASDYGFTPIADRDGFLVVYPEGVDGHWNNGSGDAALSGVDVTKVDDVGFFRQLFDHVAQELKGDPQRFYVTGVSNGGSMTHRLGIELGERIAAIAPVIANLPVQLATQRPACALPVLLMNGTADPLMLWGGTPDKYSTDETIRYWLENNRGRRFPRASSVSLPDTNRRDDSTVEVTTYTGLEAPVVLYTIHGGGHTLPGGSTKAPKQVFGSTNMDISGAEEIWAFLSQHRRD